ncbi:MAG: 3-oxoacyl-ACP synthase III family protein [Myxococcales bacterium]|nr:3-oxoacyl-ACP synthase III family protein [Myxococcales bacterium]
MTVHVHGLGHFHPENEVTNAFLEELDIGTSDAWILERVGIRCRRTVLPLDYIRETKNADVRAATEATEYATSDLGVRAAEMAIARAGISKEDIGLVIGGGSAPNSVTPADAALVAKGLGIEVPSFDINSACTTFLVHMHVLNAMRPDALPPYILISVQDAITQCLDYTDRASCVLFGDGAAAAVVSTRIPGRAQVLGTDMDSSPAGCESVWVPRTGHFSQEGRTVQRFAIKKSTQEFRRVTGANGDPDRTLHFVGHQVNLQALLAIAERCGVAEERHHYNVDWFGNTCAPGCASVVSQLWDKWGPDDDIAMVGVGGGLTWAGYMLRFGDASQGAPKAGSSA